MMFTTAQRWSLSILPFVSLLLGGCGGASSEEAPLGHVTAAKIYSSSPNGTGIHIGSTQPESWLGLTGTSLTWFLTGLSQRSDGSWWATGWYSLDLGVISADAQVLSVQFHGVTQRLRAVRTTGSRLSLDLRDSLGNVRTVQDDALVGLSLKLRVPDQLGLLFNNDWLRIDSVGNVDSETGDVFGYQMSYLPEGVLGGTWSSYCKGPSGEAQRSVFYQGAQWHPMNGARVDGASLVTMTCESGSVAKCMRWGYRPWASAQLQSGSTTSLLDHHQACVHMKRASYCGDSHAQTIDGTQIYINDLLDPALHSGPFDTIEALWTPTGASCVSNRRHPELPFLGCPLPLPTCPATPSADYLLATSLPPSGSLLGLTD